MLRLGLTRAPRVLPRSLGSAAGRRHFSLDPLVSALADTVEAVHVHSGLPWWALIPLSTFALRAVGTFPLAVLQRLRMRRQNSLRPIVAATGPVLRLNLAKKALGAAAAADGSVAAMVSPLRKMRYEEIMVLAAKETRRRQKRLFAAHGVQLYKNFLLPAAQVPLWVCMSLAIRNLSGWHAWDAARPLDASLHTEGLAWFGDLAAADPLHVFPLALGAVALTNVEWTVKTFDVMRPARRTVLRPTLTDLVANVSRMAVVFLMAVSVHAPTALTLYWLSSQVFSLVQNVVLDVVLPVAYTPNRRVAHTPLTAPAAVDVHVTPSVHRPTTDSVSL